MPLTPIIDEVRRAERIGLWFLLAIIAVVLVTGWMTDYRSCERQQPVRRFQMAINPDLAKQKGVHELNCARLLPGI